MATLYSANQLIELSRNKPKELVRVLTSPNMDIRTLTNGVEILGCDVSDEELVIPVLRSFLRHVNALVRESATIATIGFYNQDGRENDMPPRDILDRMRQIANSDPLLILREQAQGILEELETRK